MPANANRIIEAITLYEEREIMYRIGNPVGSPNDQHADELKRQYYQNLLRYPPNRLNRSEKDSLRYIKDEIGRLAVHINPSFKNRLLYGHLSRLIKNFLVGTLKSINWHKDTIRQFQNRVGIEQNSLKLSESIKQAGFNQDIAPLLQKMIAQGLPNFHIRYADIKNASTDFVLHFKIIPGTGAYEFSKVDVANKPKWNQANDTDSQIWYTFSRNSDTLFTASELAHLVAGRGVCKGDSNKWYVLDKTAPYDFLKTHQFDLPTALQKLPLQKMNKVELKNLKITLESGATKEVTLIINGEPENYLLVAAPQANVIRIFDKHNRLQDINSLVSRGKEQNEKLAAMVNHAEEEVINLDVAKSKGMR